MGGVCVCFILCIYLFIVRDGGIMYVHNLYKMPFSVDCE